MNSIFAVIIFLINANCFYASNKISKLTYKLCAFAFIYLVVLEIIIRYQLGWGFILISAAIFGMMIGTILKFSKTIISNIQLPMDFRTMGHALIISFVFMVLVFRCLFPVPLTFIPFL